MYIGALLHLKGNVDGPNHGLRAYSRIIWPAQSIFDFLAQLEELLPDAGWHLLTLENVEFNVDASCSSEQELTFYRYGLN